LRLASREGDTLLLSAGSDNADRRRLFDFIKAMALAAMALAAA
jgi:hypothetical protein